MKNVLFLFAFLGVFWSVNAQNMLLSGTERALQTKELKASFTHYDLYELNTADLFDQLQSKSKFEGATALSFKLKNYTWTFSLFPTKIVADDFIELIATEDGVEELTVTPNILTFSGEVKGDYTSKVALTISPTMIYGFVEQGDKVIFFEPVEFIDEAQKGTNLTVFYDAEDVKNPEDLCAANDLDHQHFHIGGHDHDNGLLHDHDRDLLYDLLHDEEEEDAERMTCISGRIIEVVFATDYSMYTKFNRSTFSLRNFLIGLMNNVQTNYDDEFQRPVLFLINRMYYSTCSTCDPWTQSTDGIALITDFINWGNTGNPFRARFDVAQMWTDRTLDNGTLGLAALEGICTSNRYTLVQHFTSNASSLRTASSHEIGHLLGAVHTNGGIMNASALPGGSNTWVGNSVPIINSFLSVSPCLDIAGGTCSGTPTLPPAPPSNFFNSCHGFPVCVELINAACLNELEIVSRPSSLIDIRLIDGNTLCLTNYLPFNTTTNIQLRGLNACGQPGPIVTWTINTFDCGIYGPLPPSASPNIPIEADRFELGQNPDLITLKDLSQIGRNKNLLIADVSGRIIYEAKEQDDLIELYRADLPKGVLFLQIQTETGQQSFKIINP